jgi:hypothetical protein
MLVSVAECMREVAIRVKATERCDNAGGETTHPNEHFMR